MIFSLFSLIVDHPVVVFFVFLAIAFCCSSLIFINTASGADYDENKYMGPCAIISFAISVPGIFGSVVNHPWTYASPGIIAGLCYIMYLFFVRLRKRVKTRIIGKHFGML